MRSRRSSETDFGCWADRWMDGCDAMAMDASSGWCDSSHNWLQSVSLCQSDSVIVSWCSVRV